MNGGRSCHRHRYHYFIPIIMIIVIIEIEISEVGIIADVTVYLGKKTKPKTNKQTKNKKTGKKHTQSHLYQPRVLEGLYCHTFSHWK